MWIFTRDDLVIYAETTGKQIKQMQKGIRWNRGIRHEKRKAGKKAAGV